MEVLIVDSIWRGKVSLETRIAREVLVGLFIVLSKFIKAHLESSTEFNSNLLLFLENKFVVGHVLLGIGLQISANLMKIQAILIRAFLSSHEELTKLGSAKRGSKHPINQIELIYREYCNCAFPWMRVREIGWIGRTALRRIVHIIRIYYHLLQIAILPEIFRALQDFFWCNFRCEADHINKRFLYDPEISKLFYFFLG